MGFSTLPKDTSTFRRTDTGIEPSPFSLEEDPLYLLSLALGQSRHGARTEEMKTQISAQMIIFQAIKMRSALEGGVSAASWETRRDETSSVLLWAMKKEMEEKLLVSCPTSLGN